MLQVCRYMVSFIFAIVIVVLLFQVIYSLINKTAAVPERTDVLQTINIKVPEKTVQSPLTETQQVSQQEPMLVKQTMNMPGIPVPAIKSEFSLEDNVKSVDVSIDFQQQQLGRVQHHWVQPSTSVTKTSDFVGETDSGQTPVVPMATRQPLIPKIAWDNKINGWVLLAFGVTNEGNVFDIRIMDAQPRGVFEAYAISAVKKWRYESYQGPKKYVSQKIEFEYKNYPYNWGEF